MFNMKLIGNHWVNVIITDKCVYKGVGYFWIYIYLLRYFQNELGRLC